MSDNDSENGEGAFAPNQALPVANLPWDFSGTPQDGLEYLFTVRRDSKKLPRYTRTLNPFATLETEEAISAIKKTLPRSKAVPTEEWRTSFVSQFRNFRQNMRHTLNERTLSAENRSGEANALPKFDQKTWREYISGGDDGFVATQRPIMGAETKEQPEATANGLKGGHEPSLWILKRLSTRNILQLLWWHSVWLNEYSEALEESSNSTPVLQLTQVHQRWMFNLLSILDNNLVSDDVSTLRVLARSCLRLIVAHSKIKRSQSDAEVEVDGTEASGDAEERQGLGGYWMVVAAIVGVWSQFDIWEEGGRQLAVPSRSTP